MARGYRRIALACAVVTVAFGALGVSTPARAATPPNQRVAVIVKLRSDVRALMQSRFHAMDARTTATIAPGTFVVDVTASNPAAAARAVAGQPGVEYAEPNQTYRALDAAVPNDPCYSNCVQGNQWYLQADHASAAWRVTKGSSRVVVAVLDSVVRSHPDLTGKVIRGPDYSDHGDSCGFDVDVDHGTHVAGIIGAHTNNGAGVAGLGWNTPILSVGVLNDQGCGTTVSIVRGLRYAIAHHARVINMSLGGGPSAAIEDAIADARRAGALVVAAAGNEGWTTPEYPAAYSGVLSVGATGRNGALASFSNRGSWVDVAAPGADILSTGVIDGVATYSALDGTSFSTPQVSATAALLLAANPCMSADDAATRIEATAHALSGVRFGVIDTGRALTPPVRGYRIAAQDGGVFTRGGVCFHGSAGNIPLRSPVVGMASTRDDGGYWLVASDGGVFSYGVARFHGSAASLPLQKPIVAMQSTPSSNGYWLVASDGGVFSYGDAHFYGSTGDIRLRKPVVGMAVTPTGHGYWLVASDGGIFAFGDARFYGSTGALTLASPVHGMAASPHGNGYLLVGADGGVFAFGAAQFRGSASGGGGGLATSITLTNTGRGYWILHTDGSTRAFGDATPYATVPARGAVAITAARSG